MGVDFVEFVGYCLNVTQTCDCITWETQLEAAWDRGVSHSVPALGRGIERSFREEGSCTMMVEV